ncbi:MAG: ATP-binding protein [Bradyrhizobiaceae bacterium]|nr:ATP-binding protein [Bradyrhizobiaceae bacterium]
MRLTYLQRSVQLPPTSCFVFGPRGTGKTTWLRNSVPDATWVNLLDPSTFTMMSANPGRLREIVMASAAGTTVVVDEVQREPRLLDVVHQLISDSIDRRFILTGSSARSLRRKGTNLLGGRAVEVRMHPFLARELADVFDLEQALHTGMIPTIVSSPTPAEQMRAYAHMYIHEEVHQVRLTRNVGAFSRFLEAISFSQGSVLNMNNVAEECEVPRSTVVNYLGILEDLLLAFTLPVFRKKTQRRLTTHPKFYFFDAGVYRAFRPVGPLNKPEEIDGIVLESLVIQHLRAWCDYTHARHELFYWRTADQVEVDAVVYGHDGLWAFEVKNTQTIRNADASGLRSFKREYPIATCAVIYRGQHHLVRDGIRWIPADLFLRSLTPNTPMVQV